MKFFKRSAPLSDKHAFIALSVLMSISSAQVSLNAYIDSLYLSKAIQGTAALQSFSFWEHPDKIIGTLYTLASLVTLIIFFTIPRILRRFGNYRWTLGIMVSQFVALLGLAYFNSAFLIIPLFIIETTLVSIIYFNFDVFIERYSKDEFTGTIRGFIKALTSLAWLIPPFIAGTIVEHHGFPLVYFSGAMLLVPAILLMMYFFGDFKDMHYEQGPLFLSNKEIHVHPDVPRIFWAYFFLQFFYAWMIIYAPIYFHNTLGVSYEDFGIILTIALTAFVILPSPEGILADRYLGEKELLIAGFLFMAVSSFAIPYFSDARLSLWWWGGLLFLGRMGAATVETMTDVFFFKQIDGNATPLIGYYRRASPMAYVLAPLLASLLLGFGIVNLRELFTILGFVMILALYFPLHITDTK